MRHLIVCCDGTWNTSDQRQDGIPNPTNVVRLHHALADEDADGNPQLKYYHPGVGSEGTWWEKAAGGGFGLGLTHNIMSAYRWLGGQYEEGDRISLFGFSRGAYTVRSLAGIIVGHGLLNLRGLKEPEVWKRVAAAEQAYRDQKSNRNWAKGWAFHGTGAPAQVQIHFLGVWDTVGALGIPNSLGILDLLDRFSNFEFHDTSIGPNVLNARHAVALDEKRTPFSPTLWTTGAQRSTVKQIWFPGVHCDVGGGYRETGLSDGALAWMMDEAAAPEIGLAFKPKMRVQVKPDHQGVLHDSFTGAMKALRSRPRSAPLLLPRNRRFLHESTLNRIIDPPITEGSYRPTYLLEVGQERSLSVYAGDPWNATGLWLEKGATYVFRATGEWMDRNIKCGPGGMDDGKFHLGELAQMAGTVLGKLEGAFRWLAGNDEADFKFTRRDEDIDWFRLVGAVANGKVLKGGRILPHEKIDIGEGCEYRIKASGYLYCYPNDAWGFYENNKGSVRLTIRRID